MKSKEHAPASIHTVKGPRRRALTDSGAFLALSLLLGLAACGGGNSTPGNQAPVARIAEQVGDLLVGEPVRLDGRASTDADQDPLTFDMTLVAKPAGSTATLGEGTSLRFLVPDVDGRYDVRLRVTDGKGGESSVVRNLQVLAAPPLAITMAESEPFSGLVHLRVNRNVQAAVTWRVDGQLLGDGKLGEAGLIEWETGFLRDGSHRIEAQLQYGDGPQLRLERTAEVLNPTIKLTRPYVETYYARVGIYVEAQSIYGIDRVSVSYKGTVLGDLVEANDCGLQVCQQPPTGYGFWVQASQTGTGMVTLDLTAHDRAGNSRTVPVTVNMGP